HGDRAAETGSLRGPRGTGGQIRVHRAAAARLWRIRAAGAGRTAAPAEILGNEQAARRGVREDRPQDRLDCAASAAGYGTLPARVLHRPARVPRARATVR